MCAIGNAERVVAEGPTKILILPVFQESVKSGTRGTSANSAFTGDKWRFRINGTHLFRFQLTLHPEAAGSATIPDVHLKNEGSVWPGKVGAL